MQHLKFAAFYIPPPKKVYRSLTCAALGLTLIAAAGCGKDQPDSYPTTDKNGVPLTSPLADKSAVPATPDAAGKPMTAQDAADKAATENKAPKQDTPTEAQMGIPFYPGAQPSKSKGDLALTTSSVNVSLLTMETPDSVEKVDAFYKEKLAAAHRLADTIAGKQTIGYIDDSTPERKRSVDISTEGDKTLITLIVTRLPKNTETPPVK